MSIHLSIRQPTLAVICFYGFPMPTDRVLKLTVKCFVNSRVELAAQTPVADLKQAKTETETELAEVHDELSL